MTTYDIRPFEGAGPLRFGMAPSEVHEILGQPRNVRRNRRGELDEDYAIASAGYAENSGELVELGFVLPASVTFCGVDLFHDKAALSMLVSADGAAVAGLGFIVFPSLGIALADFSSAEDRDRVITVFARNRWTGIKGFVPFPGDGKSTEGAPLAGN